MTCGKTRSELLVHNSIITVRWLRHYATSRVAYSRPDGATVFFFSEIFVIMDRIQSLASKRLQAQVMQFINQ
jgi:hypothetical protein